MPGKKTKQNINSIIANTDRQSKLFFFKRNTTKTRICDPAAVYWQNVLYECLKQLNKWFKQCNKIVVKKATCFCISFT